MVPRWCLDPSGQVEKRKRIGIQEQWRLACQQIDLFWHVDVGLPVMHEEIHCDV